VKAIGYIRASTDKQSNDGVSLEMQAAKIRAYSDLKLVEIIEDAGFSAKNIEGRPGFRKALDRVLEGDIDALVVYKLDRAFRSTRDALDVAEAINKKGKGLHSITEKLDTTSAIGEFFFTLMASLAQMERRLVGERTKAAMAQKASNGEKVSSQAPYGYRYDDSVAVPDEHEQKCLQILRSLHRDHPEYSLRKLAKNLESMGHLNRNGNGFSAGCIKSMLAK